jgi:carbonic anhydrase
MDARLNPREVLGLKDGEAHVIRNAGGIVTDDVIRSLTISQRLLGTREIMLLRHTDCGMQTFTDGDLADTIEKETGTRPPYAMGAFADLEDSVRDSIARLRASPFLTNVDAIRGFVYDVETGCVREVGS